MMVSDLTVTEICTELEDRVALAHASATAEPETYAEGRHDGYISALLEILLWIEEQTS